MKKEELFGILALLIIALGLFMRPQITGMVVGEVNHTLLEINKVFNESTGLNLSLEGNLTYLDVSGSYSGEKVKIYLDDLLVYTTNNKENLITGNVIGANISDNQSIPRPNSNITGNSNSTLSENISGPTNVSTINTSAEQDEVPSIMETVSFNNECEETCILDNYPANATMRIVLDNATLNLTSITYTYLQTADTKIIQNETYNNSKNISYTEFDHSNVKIGEPVIWSKTVEGVDTVTLPGSAYNIKTDEDVQVNFGGKKITVEEFSELKAGKPKQILLELENISKQTTITYETPGPEKTEKHIDQYRKQVTISSDIHYRNVLAHTDIDEAERDSIQVHWLTESGRKKVDEIVYLDENDNGLIDKIEWVVPHLSNQTYEISITVLNPYEYLRDGDTWVVAFNTTGVGNLTISSPNAGWTEFLNDDPDTFDEMEFLNIRCGEESLKDQLKLLDFNGNMFDYNELESDNSLEIEKLLVEDYSCDNIGYLSNYMHKAGYATLMFEFANQKGTVRDYAYDPENYTYTFSGVSQSTNDHFAYETYGEFSFPSPGDSDSSFSCGNNITYGGDEYRTVEIGGQCWFADNLKVVNGSTDKDCSFSRSCLNGNSANCDLHGGQYSYEEMMCGSGQSNEEPSMVQGICPNGWHIPSYKEWRTVERQVCSDIGNSNCDSTFPKSSVSEGCKGQDTTTGEGEGSALAGKCSTWDSDDITNSGACNNDFGSSGLDIDGTTLSGWEGQNTITMTSTTEGADAGDVICHQLYSWRTDSCIYGYSQSSGFSVRCVKDNYTEATNSDYTNIASSDNNRWITTGANETSEYDSQMFKFFINESEENVSQIDFLWEGYGENNSGFNTSMYAWDYDVGEWVMLDTYDFRSNTDNNLTHSEVGTTERFIDSDGEITMLVKTRKFYFGQCNDTLEYGGQNYSTIQIGDQCWLQENLNVQDGFEDQDCTFTRKCYDDNSSKCDIYGGLYNRTEILCGESPSNSEPSGVQGICPRGWHLPSHYEFVTLERYACNLIGNTGCDTTFPKDTTTTGVRGQQSTGYGEGCAISGNESLWDDGKLDNEGGGGGDFGKTKLDLLPNGYDNSGSGGIGTNSFVWTCTETSGDTWYRNTWYDFTPISASKTSSSSFKIAARCIKDSSSPYIYTYNGEAYEWLSDFVGGATSPEKEYLDFKDISHTTVEDGLVKLKITEELNETSFIDRIYLLVDGDEIIELSNITDANKSLLSESDDKYLIMELGDEHYLEFPAPENYSKLEFTAEGYYLEHYKKAEIKHNSLYTDFVQIKTYINEPPTIETPTITPMLAHKTDDLNCNATPIDRTNTTLDVEYIWYNCTERPCTYYSGGNRTGLTNGTNYVINTFSSSNTHVGEVWNCSVRSYDGIKYSDAASSTKWIYGKINGTVKDGSGTAVSSADVIAVYHSDKSYVLNTTSDGSGLWSVDVMYVGNYSIHGYSPENSSLGVDADAFVMVYP